MNQAAHPRITSPNLSSASLQLFEKQSVLIIGDVFIDEYLSGDCSRISPEAPVPILRVEESKTKRVPGGAANTAANIAALGGNPVLIGLVGKDASASHFFELMQKQGIRFIPIHDGRPTMVKTRLVGARQQLLRLDHEETHAISGETEAHVLSLIRTELQTCSVVVLPDYAKGLLTPTLLREIIGLARTAKKPIIVDPRPQHAVHYKQCDFITPNWKEALGLLGEPEKTCTPAEVTRVGQSLSQYLDSNIILTLGPNGIAFFPRDNGEVFTLPTLAREVFDVSGAGDTVVAAFALAHASGLPPREAIAIANRAAGIVVGKLGTATVTREELLAAEASSARLVTRDQLSPLSNRLKAQGKTIVTLNGSFDLLHAGHLHILESARAQGDVLIVGLNSDASVKRYKAANRPIIGEQDRAHMLLALRCIDYVHLFDEDVPMPFLEAVKPHIHVNGSEYGANCIEAPTVQKNGGRIFIVEKIPGLSTSAILDRIRSET